MIVRLALSIEFGQSLHLFCLIFDPLKILFIVLSLLLLLLSMALSELLLGFESIFYCLTNQCICGCSLNVLDIQASEILFLSCWGIDHFFINDSLLTYSRIVAQSLEMLFIGWLEILIALWYFDHKSW